MTDETREVIDIVKGMFLDLKSDIVRIEDKVDKIDVRVGKIEDRVGKIEIEVAEVKDRVGKIETEVAVVKDKTVKIEATQENIINRNIQLLAEGYMPMAEKLNKLDTLSEDMEKVKIDIEVIKKAVKTNFDEHTMFAKAE